MDFRIKLVPLILGGALIYFGYLEYQLGEGVSSKPAPVSLQEIETFGPPEERYIELDRHFAVYAGCVYEYEQGRYDSGEPDENDKVNYLYYPVISYEHPYWQQIAELEEQFGTLDAIPEHLVPTEIHPISVLVRTTKFKKIGDIPDGMELVESIEGLVINRTTSLDSEEESIMRENFPSMDLDKMVILALDRKPTSIYASLGMMAGGMFLAFLGILWLASPFLFSSNQSDTSYTSEDYDSQSDPLAGTEFAENQEGFQAFNPQTDSSANKDPFGNQT
ncbi:Hypothetical protein PBC10988_9660 [Planctomycetales bacterium 10988]|nr:Hypothetical protein PBC10988_9660 [Planctomycetales bacterium 10988]